MVERAGTGSRGAHRAARARLGRGADRGALRGVTVDDEDVRAGLADGHLAVDTRLRDALRRLRREDGTFELSTPGEPAKLDARTRRRKRTRSSPRRSPRWRDRQRRARRRPRRRLELRLARLEREPPGRLHRLARR